MKPTLSFNSIPKDKSSSKSCSRSLDANPQKLAGFSIGIRVSSSNTKNASYKFKGEANFYMKCRVEQQYSHITPQLPKYINIMLEISSSYGQNLFEKQFSLYHEN